MLCPWRKTKLKKLRTLIQNVKPDHPSWKLGIKWNIAIGGFLETLINFRHIREELLKTKRKVEKFNKSRYNLHVYAKEIDYFLNNTQRKQYNYNSNKTKPGKSKRNPTKKKLQIKKQPTKTILRLQKKVWELEQNKDPYTDEEENEIFLQMFRNKDVRKYCEQPLEYNETILQTHIEISTTLNSFREMYNGFYRCTVDELLWNQHLIINRQNLRNCDISSF